MKILLIGPCPPPHGGISVHVSGIYRRLRSAGVRCETLDSTNASRPSFAIRLAQYSLRGWTLHLHVNGHNWTSWALALECGLAPSGGCVLTVHSGMTPGYVAKVAGIQGAVLRSAGRLYRRIVCVNDAIRDALESTGAFKGRLAVAPAYLGRDGSCQEVDGGLASWIEAHSPLLSTAIFFRPEYGFDVLIEGLARLREHYPSVGCLVMGSGDKTQAEKMIRESGLSENVKLLGDVDHETCLAVMERSDVFVRPTLADGDSISVREAAALGVPVVGSRVGTRPHGVKLFEPGDAAGMAAQIGSAIQSGRREAIRQEGSMSRLLEIYREIAPMEESLVSA